MGQYADDALDAALHNEMLFIDEEWVAEEDGDEIPPEVDDVASLAMKLQVLEGLLDTASLRARRTDLRQRLKNALTCMTTYQLQAAYAAGFRRSVELDIRDELLRRVSKPEQWVWLSGGKAIRLPDMTTAHIRNSIAYMERNGRGGLPIVAALRVELSRRPI